ncbi:MAG TPA: methylmalonyl-CoA epimerase [Planctomycetes bacterium]|nr:methylmalonyl-CoA epimerase [Planctomycetota bacterium]
MGMKVDHIGVAVPDLEGALDVWRDVLALEVEDIEVVPDQKVKVAKLRAGESVIELLEPTEEDSPVGRFLARSGGGIHHICLEVEDLEAALEAFAAKGLRLVDEKPRIGAGGHRIAFVHPKTMGGVLLELTEAPR